MPHDCPICLESVVKPLICPCPGRHKFCTKCLRGVLQVCCPVCRDRSQAVVAFVLRRSCPGKNREPQLLHASAEGDVHVVQGLLKLHCNADHRDESARTLLHLASENGHSSIVDLLIRKRVPLNQQDEDGRVPLHAAAYGGHCSVVRALLDARAILNKLSDHSATPLALACGAGHLDIVQLLIQQRADHTKPAQYKEILLHFAAGATQGCSVVRYLVEELRMDLHAAVHKGEMLQLVCECGGMETMQYILQRIPIALDVQEKKSGDTPLLAASQCGHIDVVKHLLQLRANVHVANHVRQTAILSSAFEGYDDIVGELLAASASPNVPGYPSALFCAVRGGHLSVARLLLGVLKPTAAVDSNQLVPEAIRTNQAEVLRLLIAHRASAIKRLSAGESLSPLRFAIGLGKRIESVGVLLEARVSVNQKDSAGETPLQHCFTGDLPGYLEVAKTLLGARAAVNTVHNITGETLLLESVMRCRPSAVELLLQAGASVNKHCPLAMAVFSHCQCNVRSKDSLAVIRLLVESRANLNMPTSLTHNVTRTPLMIAAESGRLGVVKILVDAGASLCGVTRSSTSLSDLAARHGHTQVLHFLERIANKRSAQAAPAKRQRKT